MHFFNVFYFFFAASHLKAAGNWVFAGCNDSRSSSSRRAASRHSALLPFAYAECPQFTDGHFAKWTPFIHRPARSLAPARPSPLGNESEADAHCIHHPSDECRDQEPSPTAEMMKSSALSGRFCYPPLPVCCVSWWLIRSVWIFKQAAAFYSSTWHVESHYNHKTARGRSERHLISIS